MSAAIGRGGVPLQALAKAGRVTTLAMSEAVFAEIADVLHRPRLARFIDPAQRDEIIDVLVSLAAWFEPIERVADCRDPTDDKYLELALASAATCIVSSDSDPLALHPWRGVPILRPVVYLNIA